ncbi:hypothetical protein [Marilutibacter alkalisoli]|uniref:NlpE C-terminal OB domain-containing protein n=1 Tax=Marilutibacter alkalisoli TaxID=2591633 RepID=A0A514BMX7_9GAMM|nr:hypothetical protein [Lysobacter alkalisoli]QDH68737.1 hypothetical protein FKV23_00355 [Lysobacter alkalisoli]
MSNRFRPSRLAVLSVLAAATAACATTPPPEPPSTVRGLYIHLDESHIIRPCGSSSTLWMTGSDSVLEPLRTRSAARSKALGQPHQGVYAEVVGLLEPTDVPGYANVVRVQQAELLADHLPATCQTASAAD